MNHKQCLSEQNFKDCSCKIQCTRKGICCECIKFHKKQNQIPACLKEVIDNLLAMRMKKI